MVQNTSEQGGALRKDEKAGANILIKGHKCYRCGHEWRPETFNIIPKVCPKCKNPYWDRPKSKRGKKE